MKRKWITCFLLLFLLGLGTFSAVWAKKSTVSNNSENKTSQWANDSDIDTDVDNGKDDDIFNESTEPSKLKQDSDDSYQESTGDKTDTFSSKFKEDPDDSDTEVDTTDETLP